MSRDVFVQDLPAWATSVADIPDNWRPRPLPFGHRAVIEAVLAVVPSTDFSDPYWGQLDLPGISIEINVTDEDPFWGFAFHIRSSDQVGTNQILGAILNRLGVRALDPWTDGGIYQPSEARTSWNT